MLDRLLETGPQQRKSAWGGTTSVVVHAVIIVLAVYSTGGATPRPKFIGDGPIIPIVAPPPDRGGAHHSVGAGESATSSTTVSAVPLHGIDVQVDVPPLTATSASAGVDSLLAEIGGGGSTGGSGVVLGGAAGVTSEATLDVPVRVIADRTPAYPELLRSAGIGGAVRVQFVVDTTGRAEPSSIRVLESSHELFTRAVLSSLRQSRFTAGELGGRRVRTLVERSYRFDVAAVR